MTKKQIIQNAINSYYIAKPLKIDGRKKEIKTAETAGIDKQTILAARLKQLERRKRKHQQLNEIGHADRVEFIKIVKKCQYSPAATSSRYNCTGIDWKAYHRASSNGKGWVLIAPDEPSNNWHIEDTIIFKLLSKKYN